MSDFKNVIEWYKEKVIKDGSHESIALHIQMWSSWLHKMKISHIINEDTMHFTDEHGDDIRFTPSIIVQECELFFVGEEILHDAQTGALNYKTSVPLFIHFDQISNAYVDVAPKLASPRGYVEIGMPVLPCRDEVNDYDIEQHSSVGSYFLPPHEKVVRFGNYFDKRVLYLAGVDEYSVSFEKSVSSALFGQAFLMGIDNLLSDQRLNSNESEKVGFRFDVGTKNANRVLFEFYKKANP